MPIEYYKAKKAAIEWIKKRGKKKKRATGGLYINVYISMILRFRSAWLIFFRTNQSSISIIS